MKTKTFTIAISGVKHEFTLNDNECSHFELVMEELSHLVDPAERVNVCLNIIKTSRESEPSLYRAICKLLMTTISINLDDELRLKMPIYDECYIH